MDFQFHHFIFFGLTILLFLFSLDLLGPIDMPRLHSFYNKTLGMPNVTHSLDYIVVNYKYAASSIFATTFAAIVYYLPVIAILLFK
jgi:hypothetical protein